MRRIGYANVAATVALVLAAGGFALGASAGTDGVIRACVARETGVLRVRDGGPCGKSERGLAWNRSGPPGAPGMSGYQVVTGPTVTSGIKLSTRATATCPAGKRAVGGGFLSGPPEDVDTVFSRPYRQRQWIVKRTESTGKPGDFVTTAYAVCVTVAD